MTETAPKQTLPGKETFNVNNHVFVKITPYGLKVWERFHNQYEEAYKASGIEAPKPVVDENGYTKMQLHEVMRIFGPELYNGNRNSPIEMNFRL